MSDHTPSVNFTNNLQVMKSEVYDVFIKYNLTESESISMCGTMLGDILSYNLKPLNFEEKVKVIKDCLNRLKDKIVEYATHPPVVDSGEDYKIIKSALNLLVQNSSRGVSQTPPNPSTLKDCIGKYEDNIKALEDPTLKESYSEEQSKALGMAKEILKELKKLKSGEDE